jgi:hypothetical protein
MPPVSYPDFGWSGRFSRFMHTLQVIAIAGTVGAVGGGVGVLAVMGIPGGPPRPQGASSDKAIAAGHPTTTAHSASPAQSSMPPQSAPPESSLALAAQPHPAAQPHAIGELPRTNSIAVETPPASPPTASQAPGTQHHAVREQAVAEHSPPDATQNDQRSQAAQDEHKRAVTRNLYDRAAPTASDEASSNQSTSSRSVATRKRTVKRVNRAAVAAVPQPHYAPEQQDQSAPDYPSVPIVPGRAYPGPGYQRGWRADNGDSGDWRDSRSGSYYARDAWRARRPDDDYNRGPASPIQGFFGFGGGYDWH